MKVLIVANTDWYIYRFRLPLARFLRSHGIDVVLASPSGRFAPEIQAEGFRWLAWEVGRQSVNPFIEAGAVWSLVKIFHQERPDLVHLHTIKSVLYGSLAALLIHIPSVVRSITGRGYVFLGEDLRARFLRLLVKPLYRFVMRSGQILFENAADRQYFLDEKLVAQERTHLIEGVGVDTDYYRPLPEPDGIPVALIATRMLWDKGVGTLVEAARLLHQEMEARVILVGEPDPGNPASIDAETLNQWAGEGVIEWWGWRTDMRAVFAACHLVTLPSLGEGIPTVLLEAAACGRPIVATDVAGCRDVVREGVNGLLVPPKDPQALANALIVLLKDSSLRLKMGKAGREFILERFSDKTVNEQTLDVYRQSFS